ncbi:hypothetical protein RUMHYD_03866 [Blautia hydrogenotrophica DSM 10507]|uniref:Uncharacterized protein n=1 Tax=Blautia hydrogenotrophica (strain DSM 10507 / JCM 14656 / S5a33) TaxID=476272 RepID=C0CSJ9_BLAHS|nr:hypothetical protein RUMHYD_03866 [Blautia hydrogenotrophica DSM 10507]
MRNFITQRSCSDTRSGCASQDWRDEGLKKSYWKLHGYRYFL